MVHEADPVRSAGVLAAELTAHDAPETSLSSLFGALSATVTNDWRTARPTEDHTAAKAFAALTAVRLATDEDLPRPLRVAAALRAYDQVAHVREQAARYPGVTEAEVLAAADRYEAARDDLLAGTGPDLTGYEGGLCDVYHRYRTLPPPTSSGCASGWPTRPPASRASRSASNCSSPTARRARPS